MNEVFPWMQIVQGRARKPSTQGSIEVSHKAFKAALVKWLDQGRSDNWIKGAQIVQCEVNHYPMCSCSGLSPHTIYYGKPHTASYSALLGPSFKMAKTEYGLWLAKGILMQIKRMRSNMVISQEMLESWIKVGDNMWYTCMEEEEKNDEKLLQEAFYACIADAGLVLKNSTEIVLYDEEWDNEEVEPEDDPYNEIMDHNWFWDIDDVGIPNTNTTTAVGTDADGARSTQYMTSYVNITEEATDAEGTTSTTCLTSHSNVTEKATTTAAVGTDAEGLVNAKKWIKHAQAGAMGKKVDYVLYRNKKMKINVTINWNNYYKEVTNRLFFITRNFFLMKSYLFITFNAMRKKNENEQKKLKQKQLLRRK
jgi:hypothetical protein